MSYIEIVIEHLDKGRLAQGVQSVFAPGVFEPMLSIWSEGVNPNVEPRWAHIRASHRVEEYLLNIGCFLRENAVLLESCAIRDCLHQLLEFGSFSTNDYW